MAGKALAAIGNVLSKFKIVSPFKVCSQQLQIPPAQDKQECCATALDGGSAADQNRQSRTIGARNVSLQITGVASGAEFKHYLDKAPDYRSKSPA